MKQHWEHLNGCCCCMHSFVCMCVSVDRAAKNLCAICVYSDRCTYNASIEQGSHDCSIIRESNYKIVSHTNTHNSFVLFDFFFSVGGKGERLIIAYRLRLLLLCSKPSLLIHSPCFLYLSSSKTLQSNRDTHKISQCVSVTLLSCGENESEFEREIIVIRSFSLSLSFSLVFYLLNTQLESINTSFIIWFS